MKKEDTKVLRQTKKNNTDFLNDKKQKKFYTSHSLFAKYN